MINFFFQKSQALLNSSCAKWWDEFTKDILDSWVQFLYWPTALWLIPSFWSDVYVKVDPAASVEEVQSDIAALLNPSFSDNFLNLTSDPDSISVLPVGTYSPHSSRQSSHTRLWKCTRCCVVVDACTSQRLTKHRFLWPFLLSWKKDVCLCHMKLTFFIKGCICAHNYICLVLVFYGHTADSGSQLELNVCCIDTLVKTGKEIPHGCRDT